MIPALVAQIAPSQTADAELPDIQDIISPQASLSYGWIIIIAVVGVLVVALVIFLLVYFIRKDNNRSHQIPAGRIALKKLDELETQTSTLSANVFSLQVSDILKDYLKERFKDSFRYETSEEFIKRLSSGASRSLPQSLQTDLANFVGLCDQLKFARFANAEDHKLPLLAEARRIIREPININATPPVS